MIPCGEVEVHNLAQTTDARYSVAARHLAGLAFWGTRLSYKQETAGFDSLVPYHFGLVVKQHHAGFLPRVLRVQILPGSRRMNRELGRHYRCSSLVEQQA